MTFMKFNIQSLIHLLYSKDKTIIRTKYNSLAKKKFIIFANDTAVIYEKKIYSNENKNTQLTH